MFKLAQVVLRIMHTLLNLIHFPKTWILKTKPLSQKPRLTNPSWTDITHSAGFGEEKPLVPVCEAGVPNLEHLAIPSLQDKTPVQSRVHLPPKDRLEDVDIRRDSLASQLLDEAIDHGGCVRRELHWNDAEVVEDVHELRLEGNKQPAAQVVKTYRYLTFRQGHEPRFRRRILQPNLRVPPLHLQHLRLESVRRKDTELTPKSMVIAPHFLRSVARFLNHLGPRKMTVVGTHGWAMTLFIVLNPDGSAPRGRPLDCLILKVQTCLAHAPHLVSPNSHIKTINNDKESTFHEQTFH
ncbi:hypothetical protein AXF42_Ash011492 [Apostasia shenzhenica]|uniref:Uncharacterized protein n=1 Tax=Apostasia shenzhenica TaxID=1088818 RepID=A0A2I0BAS8_9ASPA|nr:hypothetical protein AXF42_Ash011492 [Apostasia shenzhenica]